MHLSSLAYRLEGTTDYDLTQVWTSPYVPGERYLDKAVYILTSERTFSAAEEFTYDLQALKRVTVIGATTAGGANPGGPYRLGDHFYAGMPRGHSINPVTKTNWEGTGIQADVKVPATDAIKVARRMAGAPSNRFISQRSASRVASACFSAVRARESEVLSISLSSADRRVRADAQRKGDDDGQRQPLDASEGPERNFQVGNEAHSAPVAVGGDVCLACHCPRC